MMLWGRLRQMWRQGKRVVVYTTCYNCHAPLSPLQQYPQPSRFWTGGQAVFGHWQGNYAVAVRGVDMQSDVSQGEGKNPDRGGQGEKRSSDQSFW